MREDYIDSTPERDIYTSPTFEELDSSYDEVSTTQPLEDDNTSDNEHT